MPIAITEEQMAVQASIRDWARRTGSLALVRRLEPATPGRDEAAAAGTGPCWDELAGLGIFAIALPEELGGAGGTVADLAAAVEELATALVPGPVTPTVLAALALAGLPGVGELPGQAPDGSPATQPAAASQPTPATQQEAPSQPGVSSQSMAVTLLTALAAGQESVATALAADGLTGTHTSDGTLRVTGETGPVLGGGSTSKLLLAAATDTGDVWFVLPADHPGVTIRHRAPVDFSRSLASIQLTGLDIAPEQILTGLCTNRMRMLAATLYAAEAAGVAGWCCGTAAAYARTREQFGRPIGQFQAVKHLCAGMLCRAERATVLAWDAARAATDAPAEHPFAAAAAAAVALDAAVDNAKDCIQVLGGIGFTWEHDAHLYLRRALAVRQLLGGGAEWRGRTAGMALAGARRRLGRDKPSRDKPSRDKPSRDKPSRDKPSRDKPSRDKPSQDKPSQDKTGKGSAAGGEAQPDIGIGAWAGPAITQHGTAAQAERFAGPTLRGEITWCQLFSEPEAGSDLASLRTRAEQVDGGWQLTGQKVWTSLAREADWAICLARTDPTVPKHRGLSFFLVDMTSPGIDIRPLREITGRAVFNEVFLDQVFVPGECLVGSPGDGWRIARSTLATERVAMGQGSAIGEDAEALLSAVRRAGFAADQGVIDQLGALVADGLAGSLMDLRAALRRQRGAAPGAESAVRKLVGVTHRQSVAEIMLALHGPEGAAADGPAADAVYQFLLTRCLSIAGGTTQILMSVVAEQVLGLPRDPAPVPSGQPAREPGQPAKGAGQPGEGAG